MVLLSPPPCFLLYRNPYLKQPKRVSVSGYPGGGFATGWGGAMESLSRVAVSIVVICLTGLFPGTEAGSRAAGAISMGGLQPASPIAARTTGGLPRALPEKAARPEGKVDLPKGASQDWWGQVQRRIAEDEYALVWKDATASKGPERAGVVEAGWSAPNRAQGFEARFSETGVVVSPSRGDASWTWGLSLAAWGRPGALLPLGKASLHVEKNRIEAGRTGLSEWFLNDERGLEQGFTIFAPPAGTALSPRHPLVLDLALSGDLHPRFSEDGQAVDFFDGGGGAVLRYASLKVVDAAGRSLPSRFEGWIGSASSAQEPLLSCAAAGGVRIAIDDSAAVYPISVDPIATSHAWMAESHQAHALYGWSVGTAGDVNGDGYSDLIVGAFWYDNGSTVDEGRVYVYAGSSSGPSTTPAWTLDSNQVDAYFGRSVGTAGDVNGDGYSDIIVGAPHWKRALVYLGSASGLSLSPAWSPEPPPFTGAFGSSVGTAGDVNGDGYSDVIVGDDSYSNGQAGEGAAFVYLGSPTGLYGSYAWKAEGDQIAAQLGNSVGTAGDVNGDGYSDVIVGAAHYNNDLEDEGRAYVYTGGPAGPSSSPAWTGEGDQLSAFFGWSVGTAGDVNGDGYSDVIVGIIHYSNVEADEGGARVYLGSASGLSPSPGWTAESDQASAEFGSSVGTAGDVNGDGYSDVIVGAHQYNHGYLNEGRTYVYLGSATGIVTASGMYLDMQIGMTGANFGECVGTAGDVNGDGYSDVVVGAPGYSDVETSEGAAFAYLGSASGLSSIATWTPVGETAGDRFAVSVAPAGDVNGDGYSDVMVGAYAYSTNTGKAYLFSGGALGLSATPSWTAVGESTNNYFGRSVATAGDVNGDGYSDVVVGADGNSSSTGKAYLYFGGTSGLSTTSSWTAVGESASNYFGASVAPAGDVNGDGYSDVVVGAYGNTGFTGKAYLYQGGATGLSTASSWTAVGEAVSNAFGYSVATAGDVNGDGYSDVVIGAYRNNSDTGKAYLYQGSASGLSGASSWSAVGAAASNYFGYTVATAGDVNRDGYADVVVGAYGYSSNYGRVYYYLGTPVGLSSSVNWIAGTSAGALFGTSVASAGDVNGDGYSDVIVGGPGWGTNQGRARLYLGSPAGLTLSSSAIGQTANNFFSASVASAGDVNGDGYSDVVVGAYGYGTNTGKAYLYLGNGEPGGGGVPVRPMQLRSDGNTPIAPLGLAYEKAFRIGLNLRAPVGRDLVRLEWQTVQLGGSFDFVSNPIQHETTWWNSGAAGHYRKAPVSLPDEPGPYLWRARIAYFNARSPFQNHGPWFTSAANGLLEADLRSTSTTAPPPCVLPDEPCWLYSVVKNGSDYTLNWQDPNQSDQRTGWNIRRSNEAAPPKSTWPLVGTNVVDMDQSAPNYQWTDHSGADPGPGGVWYYQVTAYNADCPAEGPF
jgi:hypothetical protein